MQLCKDTASARLPNVPLAYIQVNRPSVNGGSMSSTFRANPPDGPYASGSCDVFKNGRVSLSFNHLRHWAGLVESGDPADRRIETLQLTVEPPPEARASGGAAFAGR